MITDLWYCITIREFQADRCGQRGITGPSYTTLHLLEHISVKVRGLCVCVCIQEAIPRPKTKQKYCRAENLLCDKNKHEKKKISWFIVQAKSLDFTVGYY